MARKAVEVPLIFRWFAPEGATLEEIRQLGIRRITEVASTLQEQTDAGNLPLPDGLSLGGFSLIVDHDDPEADAIEAEFKARGIPTEVEAQR